MQTHDHPQATDTAAVTPQSHDEHAAHDKHEGHSVAMFRDRFWLSLLLSVPVLMWSAMLQDLLGYTAPNVPGDRWIPMVFGTAVFVYGGSPFLKGGWNELRDRAPGMMLLISLAITVAFASSLASQADLLDLDFWWELVLLIDVMLLGHWQEMKAIGQASSALDALAALLPDIAERVEGADTEEVAISDLQPGDLVLVRPGGRVPADGTIETGRAEFDESMITGESRAAPRDVGERVVAGTVAADSSVRVRVDAVGDDTALAGIRRLVADAQASRSRAQALADRAAAVLFYAALTAGIVTFAAWLALGDTDQALERAVTVLVIACPHALGLAIPLVIALSTAMSARNGILVKDRIALERMRTVDAVLFDKTGTLTEGRPTVHGAVALDGDDDALLRVAAAVEADSEHPLARAIVAAAEHRGAIPSATGFRSIAGRGVEAEVGGRIVSVGGPALLDERGLELPSGLEPKIEAWRDRGATVLTVVDDGRVAGALALEDAVRPQSRRAVEALHDLGVRVVMITGDAQQVADAVAGELGVDEVMAEVLPEQKDSKVAELQARGLRVAMVGDGVNDAPALARADVGIAIGAGTDVAIESAGVVLASDDPRGVVSVRRLSAASYRKMQQNLAWATGYNVAAIPLAAGAFAWAGIVLPPALAAALMSLSTIVVALNAQLLRRVDLRPDTIASSG
ncbi:MAG: copper-translocating P-type ATPase [Actinomycetota bacterium]|nr:copper-translocating P-type ATPase [Actinomycetota bacterium]MDH5223412.1 copper-translocating P-type ATPase [Actinomycetota bacterium]MDH5312274.1 copper-translocating P-type ATPase [Actinomycetota bacterium]